MPRTYNLFLRIISIILIGALCSHEISYASPDGLRGSPAQTSRLDAILRDPSCFETPFEFCQLKGIHHSPSAPLIIHIQDPHSNLSGQENLSKTLDFLIRKYPISDILVEGSSKDSTLDPLKKLAPSKTKLMQVARSFLIQGKIAGEEYFNLAADDPIQIQGIEDRALYFKSIELYARLTRQREPALNYLNQIQIAVDKLKIKFYPKELLEYERLMTKDSGLAAQDERFNKLFQMAQNGHIELSKFPNLFRLSALLSKEKRGDFDKAGREQAAGIDFEKLLDETERMEEEIYRSCLNDYDGSLIHAIDRYLGLLQSAYKIRMTTKEFNEFKKDEPDFLTLAYLAFLNKKLVERGYFEDLVSYQDILERGKVALYEFYESVGERDLAFMQNTEKILGGRQKAEGGRKSWVAVMITGGYHTQHLKELFQQKGYSYIVLAPRVTSETSQAKYEKLLLEPLKGEVRLQSNLPKEIKPDADYVKAPELVMVGARLIEFGRALGADEALLRKAVQEIEARPDNAGLPDGRKITPADPSSGARLEPISLRPTFAEMVVASLGAHAWALAVLAGLSVWPGFFWQPFAAFYLFRRFKNRIYWKSSLALLLVLFVRTLWQIAYEIEIHLFSEPTHPEYAIEEVKKEWKKVTLIPAVPAPHRVSVPPELRPVERPNPVPEKQNVIIPWKIGEQDHPLFGKMLMDNLSQKNSDPSNGWTMFMMKNYKGQAGITGFDHLEFPIRSEGEGSLVTRMQFYNPNPSPIKNDIRVVSDEFYFKIPKESGLYIVSVPLKKDFSLIRFSVEVHPPALNDVDVTLDPENKELFHRDRDHPASYTRHSYKEGENGEMIPGRGVREYLKAPKILFSDLVLKRGARLAGIDALIQAAIQKFPGLGPQQVDQIRRAYRLAEDFYRGDKKPRAEGKPAHVLRVAENALRYASVPDLKELFSNPQNVADQLSISILHDLLEDALDGQWGELRRQKGMRDLDIQNEAGRLISDTINKRVQKGVLLSTKDTPPGAQGDWTAKIDSDLRFDERLIRGDRTDRVLSLMVQLDKLADRYDNYSRWMTAWWRGQHGSPERVQYEIQRTVKLISESSFLSPDLKILFANELQKLMIRFRSSPNINKASHGPARRFKILKVPIQLSVLIPFTMGLVAGGLLLRMGKDLPMLIAPAFMMISTGLTASIFWAFRIIHPRLGKTRNFLRIFSALFVSNVILGVYSTIFFINKLLFSPSISLFGIEETLLVSWLFIFVTFQWIHHFIYKIVDHSRFGRVGLINILLHLRSSPNWKAPLGGTVGSELIKLRKKLDPSGARLAEGRIAPLEEVYPDLYEQAEAVWEIVNEFQNEPDFNFLTVDKTDATFMLMLSGSRDHSPSSVFIENGKVLGVLIVGPNNIFAPKKFDAPFYIYFIGVKKDAQRRGIAQKLLYSLASRIPPGETMFLDVEPNNTRAIQLYQKAGFQKIGEYVQKDPRTASKSQRRTFFTYAAKAQDVLNALRPAAAPPDGGLGSPNDLSGSRLADLTLAGKKYTLTELPENSEIGVGVITVQRNNSIPNIGVNIGRFAKLRETLKAHAEGREGLFEEVALEDRHLLTQAYTDKHPLYSDPESIFHKLPEGEARAANRFVDDYFTPQEKSKLLRTSVGSIALVRERYWLETIAAGLGTFLLRLKKDREFLENVKTAHKRAFSRWHSSQVRQNLVPGQFFASLFSSMQGVDEYRPDEEVASAEKVLRGWKYSTIAYDTMKMAGLWPKDVRMWLPHVPGYPRRYLTVINPSHAMREDEIFDPNFFEKRYVSLSEGGAVVGGFAQTPFLIFSDAVRKKEAYAFADHLRKTFPEYHDLKIYFLPAGFVTFDRDSHLFLIENLHIDTVTGFIPAAWRRTSHPALMIDPRYWDEIRQTRMFNRLMNEQKLELRIIPQDEARYNPANFVQMPDRVIFNYAPKTLQDLDLKPEAYRMLPKEAAITGLGILGGGFGCGFAMEPVTNANRRNFVFPPPEEEIVEPWFEGQVLYELDIMTGKPTGARRTIVWSDSSSRKARLDGDATTFSWSWLAGRYSKIPPSAAGSRLAAGEPPRIIPFTPERFSKVASWWEDKYEASVLLNESVEIFPGQTLNAKLQPTKFTKGASFKIVVGDPSGTERILGTAVLGSTGRLTVPYKKWPALFRSFQPSLKVQKISVQIPPKFYTASFVLESMWIGPESLPSDGARLAESRIRPRSIQNTVSLNLSVAVLSLLQNLAVFVAIPAFAVKPFVREHVLLVTSFVTTWLGALVYSVYWYLTIIDLRKVYRPEILPKASRRYAYFTSVPAVLFTTSVIGTAFPSFWKIPATLSWLLLSSYLAWSGSTGYKDSIKADGADWGTVRLNFFKTARIVLAVANLGLLLEMILKMTGRDRFQTPILLFFPSVFSILEYVQHYGFVLSSQAYGLLWIHYPFRLLEHYLYKDPMPVLSPRGGWIGKYIRSAQRKVNRRTAGARLATVEDLSAKILSQKEGMENRNDIQSLAVRVDAAAWRPFLNKEAGISSRDLQGISKSPDKPENRKMARKIAAVIMSRAHIDPRNPHFKSEEWLSKVFLAAKTRSTNQRDTFNHLADMTNTLPRGPRVERFTESQEEIPPNELSRYFDQIQNTFLENDLLIYSFNKSGATEAVSTNRSIYGAITATEKQMSYDGTGYEYTIHSFRDVARTWSIPIGFADSTKPSIVYYRNAYPNEREIYELAPWTVEEFQKTGRWTMPPGSKWISDEYAKYRIWIYGNLGLLAGKDIDSIRRPQTVSEEIFHHDVFRLLKSLGWAFWRNENDPDVMMRVLVKDPYLLARYHSLRSLEERKQFAEAVLEFEGKLGSMAEDAHPSFKMEQFLRFGLFADHSSVNNTIAPEYLPMAAMALEYFSEFLIERRIRTDDPDTAGNAKRAWLHYLFGDAVISDDLKDFAVWEQTLHRTAKQVYETVFFSPADRIRRPQEQSRAVDHAGAPQSFEVAAPSHDGARLAELPDEVRFLETLPNDPNNWAVADRFMVQMERFVQQEVIRHFGLLRSLTRVSEAGKLRDWIYNDRTEAYEIVKPGERPLFKVYFSLVDNNEMIMDELNRQKIIQVLYKDPKSRIPLLVVKPSGQAMIYLAKPIPREGVIQEHLVYTAFDRRNFWILGFTLPTAGSRLAGGAGSVKKLLGWKAEDRKIYRRLLATREATQEQGRLKSALSGSRLPSLPTLDKMIHWWLVNENAWMDLASFKRHMPFQVPIQTAEIFWIRMNYLSKFGIFEKKEPAKKGESNQYRLSSEFMKLKEKQRGVFLERFYQILAQMGIESRNKAWQVLTRKIAKKISDPEFEASLKSKIGQALQEADAGSSRGARLSSGSGLLPKEFVTSPSQIPPDVMKELPVLAYSRTKETRYLSYQVSPAAYAFFGITPEGTMQLVNPSAMTSIGSIGSFTREEIHSAVAKFAEAQPVNEAARQTTHAVLSAVEGEPVVLNIIAEDVLTIPSAAAMVEKAAPFLESRHIYLRFGKVFGNKFIVDETYRRLHSKNIPEGSVLESFIGTKESIANLKLPEKAGIGLVEKEENGLIRLLDTFIKIADIKRNRELDKIRQNISSIADIGRVNSADENKLYWLNEIPSDFNEHKDIYLHGLEPFTIRALRLTVEEAIVYAKRVTQAMGQAA